MRGDKWMEEKAWRLGRSREQDNDEALCCMGDGQYWGDGEKEE